MKKSLAIALAFSALVPAIVSTQAYAASQSFEMGGQTVTFTDVTKTEVKEVEYYYDGSYTTTNVTVIYLPDGAFGDTFIEGKGTVREDGVLEIGYSGVECPFLVDSAYSEEGIPLSEAYENSFTYGVNSNWGLTHIITSDQSTIPGTVVSGTTTTTPSTSTTTTTTPSTSTATTTDSTVKYENPAEKASTDTVYVTGLYEQMGLIALNNYGSASLHTALTQYNKELFQITKWTVPQGMELYLPETLDGVTRLDAIKETVDTYTVKDGDTLGSIAKSVYGSASKYVEIFEANTDRLTSANKIYVGQVLVLPTLELN